MRNSEGSKEAESSKERFTEENTESKVHRTGSMGQRKAEVGKRGRWEAEKLKAQSPAQGKRGWRMALRGWRFEVRGLRQEG
jgi:hypothetical protein